MVRSAFLNVRLEPCGPSGGLILRDALQEQRSSESDSKRRSLYQSLARRRESNLTLAIMTQASALAMVASKSLARRRLRPNQAKVRSTTQRRGSGLKVPMLWGLVTISIVHLPRSASASSSFGPRSDRRRYEWRSPRPAV